MLVDQNQDPEDYPRSGYIFNALARHRIAFRDYGDLVQVSGYDDGGALDPRTDDPQFGGVDDRAAATAGWADGMRSTFRRRPRSTAASI